jgi:hypothetical protein
VVIFDTRTGEEIIGMASNETYDGTLATSINAVVATSSASLGLETGSSYMDRADQEESVGAGPTGSAQGVEGVIVSGHEDRYIRFFDANSGKSHLCLMSKVYFTNQHQGNAHTQCSHILRPSHHSLCPRTVERRFQQVTMHRSGSGRSRRDSARKTLRRTDP